MARPSSLTAPMRARITTLYDQGVPVREIVRAVGVGMSAFYAVAAEIPSRRQPAAREEYAKPVAVASPARRRCLCCQRLFQSAWVGNRLCIKCR